MCLLFLLRCGTNIYLLRNETSLSFLLPWSAACFCLLYWSLTSFCWVCYILPYACTYLSAPTFAKLKLASRRMFHEASMPCINTRWAYILNKMDYIHGIYNAPFVFVINFISSFNLTLLLLTFSLLLLDLFAYFTYILARSSPITKASSDYTPNR